MLELVHMGLWEIRVHYVCLRDLFASSCVCFATLFILLGWLVMKCLQPQKEDALQLHNCRTIVRANMLFPLSVTVYDHKKHKPMGLILVLEHKFYICAVFYLCNFCGTVLVLLG